MGTVMNSPNPEFLDTKEPILIGSPLHDYPLPQ